MDSSDYLTTEPHIGQCSHCKSDVPLDATTCTGCGSHWGFRNGMSRDQLYRDAGVDIRLGLGYVLLMAVFVALAASGFKFMMVFFLFGLLFSLKFLVTHLLSGLINRRAAVKASSEEIDWWLHK